MGDGDKTFPPGGEPSVSLKHINILRVISRQYSFLMKQRDKFVAHSGLEGATDDGQEVLLGNSIEELWILHEITHGEDLLPT